MAEQCWKCESPLRWSAAIGDFCPNPSCDVVDALDLGASRFEIHLVTAPTAAPLPRTARAIARAPSGATPPRG
jgi:hypothetical protein